MQFLTRRTTESSNLVWTPSSGSSAKIAGKLFHPVHHLFSKGEGKQLFEQGPEADSWTPGRAARQALQPPAAARLSWQQPGLGPRPAWGGTPRSSRISQPSRPSDSCVTSCTVHTSSCLAQAFPKGLEKAGYTHASIFWHWIRYGDCSAWACLVKPPHSWVAAFSSPLRHSCYLIKWLLSHFCSNPAQAWVIQTSLKADTPLATASSRSVCVEFIGGSGLWTVTFGLVNETCDPCLQVSCWSCIEDYCVFLVYFPSDYSFVWVSPSIVPVLVSVWM